MDRLKNPFADADSAAKQEDQTPSSASNDDFLAFSSTSTPAKPHHESFKIKRGKSNRMGNWERFGAFNQDHQSSPVYKSQRQAWNQDRGSGQNFQPREPWSESGYFHPSMLENPWSDLQVNTNTESLNAPSSADVSSVKLSDSMIPQVDDTLLERDMDIKKFEDLEEKKGDSNEYSNYSDSSDEDNVVITTGEETRNTQKNISLRPDIDNLDESVDSKSSNVGDISKSDSMIPLVGDSILAQNVTLDT